MAGGTSSKVVQVTNIAPQATKDQLQALFGLLGTISEIRLYPSIRDVSVPVVSRICYVRYAESSAVATSQHMTNTVFIDRALICIPVASIPDEYRALEMAANGTLVPGFNNNQQADSKLPHEVVSKVEGQMPNQVIKTYDPKLTNENLPEYPALPVNYDEKKVEETRRTILILNPEADWRLDDLIDFFKRAGEVKYARFAETDGRAKLVMMEFQEQKSIIYALRMQGTYYRGTPLNLHHSTQPITKPEAKSNEAAQKEIEEAMSIVKECHNQISAVLEPAFGIIGAAAAAVKEKVVVSQHPSRDRSRSRSRRSKSRKSSRRSRSRKRSTSRSRRKRSPSVTKRRRSRSRSRSKRRKKSRSRSKDRKSHRRDRRDHSGSRTSKHKSSRSSRHRSKSRDRRTKSRERSHSRHRSDKKVKKSHREKERKYSHSRSRSKSPQKSPVVEKSKSSRRRSVEKKMKRISEEKIRDYDAEEKLMDDNGCEASSKSDNMDISDSP